MAHTIVKADIPNGYSGNDHLIDSDDIDAIQALVGSRYRTLRAAEKAACATFRASADIRCAPVPILIATVNSVGEYCGELAAEAESEDDWRSSWGG